MRPARCSPWYKFGGQNGELLSWDDPLSRDMAESSFSVVLSVILGGVPLLALLVVVGYTRWLYSHRKGDARVPKGSSIVLPIFGETVQMLFSNPDKHFITRHQKYGGMYTTHLFGHPTVAVATPEAHKFFLSSKSFRMSMSSTFTRVMGTDGIIASEGDVHLRARKAILSQVASEFMKKFIGSIDQIAQTTVNSFQDGDTINSLDETRKFAFSVSSLLVCDYLTRNNPRTTQLQKLLDCLEEGLFCLEIPLPGTTFTKALQARQGTVQILEELIARRKEEGGTKQHGDMLQTFLQSEEPLTHAQIVDNFLTVIFASYGATALILTWIFKFLNENPDIRQQVQEEQDAIARRNEAGDLLTMADLKDMPLSLRVILETLRIANIVAFTLREATEDVEYNGLLIPKGWKVLLNFRYINVGPDNHLNPLHFDPSRFMNPPKPGTFSPFGGGTRHCPGNDVAKQEMLIFIHRFFTKYSYKPAGPDLGVKYFPKPTLNGGYPITLATRKSSSIAV